MSDRANIVYLYDETFEGLLCCVFESYTRKEIPLLIEPISATQALLYEAREIITIEENYERVRRSLREKLGKNNENLIYTAFLYGGSEKGDAIFRFIRLGYSKGPIVYDMLQLETVAKVHNMAKAVENEKHLLLGFVRFAEVNGGLVATIEPKHLVIPLMQRHFTSRYPEERFLIYDKTHHMLMLYQPYEVQILNVDDFIPPDASEDEANFQSLWSGYFKAIAINERYNPRCQMGHMPKRFWKHMLETQASKTSALMPPTSLVQQAPTLKSGKPQIETKTP